jgi:hypothetical protein
MHDIHYLDIKNYFWITISWWQFFWQMARLTRLNTTARTKLAWHYAAPFYGDGWGDS